MEVLSNGEWYCKAGPHRCAVCANEFDDGGAVEYSALKGPIRIACPQCGAHVLEWMPDPPPPPPALELERAYHAGHGERPPPPPPHVDSRYIDFSREVPGAVPSDYVCSMAAEIVSHVWPRMYWPGRMVAVLSSIAFDFGVLYARAVLKQPDDDREVLPELEPVLQPEELEALDSAMREAHRVHEVALHTSHAEGTPSEAALIVVAVLQVTATWREVYPSLERLCNVLGVGPGFRHLDRRLDALRALAVDYARAKLTKVQLGDASRWLDSLESRQTRSPR